MNKKAIHRIASVVMALVMILGNTATTQAATNPSIYWGALVNGNVPSSTNLQGVFNTFETRSTKKMSIIHWGQPWMMKDGSWGEFQTSYFTNVRNHGSIPMINWASHRLGDGINQSNFQLRDIYNGTYDTYIRRWATDARNWGHPLFLRFNHEMNGWWFPWGEGKTSSGIVNGNSAGDFVIAWRHVHDIFEEVGATNVTWVWAANHVGDTTDYAALSTVYPGNAYVDWTGFDVYNKYSSWAGLNPLLSGSEGMTWFKNSYNQMLSIAPNKPMMLAEFASIEAGDGGAKKAAWITDALTTQIPINFPNIKAVVWMNWDINTGKTYPIESSQAATNAWAAAISSAVYASNQFANLNTSPIPALSALSLPTATAIPPSPTPISSGIYDDTHATWQYAGIWTSLATSGPYNGTVRFSKDLNATASFTFTGGSFIFKYAKHSSRGNIEVWIDGVKTDTLNANSASLVWQSTFSKTGLSAGTHTVVFKHGGPSGSHIDIDSIQIIPASPTATATATVIPPSPTATATTIGPSPTTATSTVLTAMADSYIDSANPSSVYGTSTSLYVNADPLKTTFLKFDLSPLAGKTLSSVILKFKTTSATTAGSVDTSNVKLVNDLLWKEPYLSHVNSVPISVTTLGTVPANTMPDTWYTITLSASNIQNNVGGLLSMAIEATGSDNLLLFSREAVDQPQLIITYQ